MPIIYMEELSKLYGFGEAATVALDEISLSIEEGEFVAVMGASGSGKSTLMNVIGLLDRPTHGVYNLSGHSVAKLRPNQRAKIRRDRIGFVFQSYNLLPRLSVIENVALPLAYRGMPLTRRLRHAASMLERVGLAEREYYLPRHLSGGQTQSAAIARALVNNPPIIIADEPTGNLDSDNSRLVMELLASIHKSGTTILLVTHNPELTRYASRVVYMHDGAIIYDEATKLGEVASRARQVMYTRPKTTEEDDWAGVSTLMKAIPDASSKRTVQRPRKPAKKTKRRRSHGKQRRSRR